MELDSGYYWVREEGNPDWMIGHWDKPLKIWYFIGDSFSYENKDLIKINEDRILPPNN